MGTFIKQRTTPLPFLLLHSFLKANRFVNTQKKEIFFTFEVGQMQSFKATFIKFHTGFSTLYRFVKMESRILEIHVLLYFLKFTSGTLRAAAKCKKLHISNNNAY